MDYMHIMVMVDIEVISNNVVIKRKIRNMEQIVIEKEDNIMVVVVHFLFCTTIS